MLAGDVVEQELVIAPNDAKLHYYLGEVNRLKFQDPDSAALEHAWLYDEDHDEKLTAKLSSFQNTYIENAQNSYQKSIELDQTLLLGYKGLGLLAMEQGNNSQAKSYFEQYLQADGIKDRRYIESLKSKL